MEFTPKDKLIYTSNSSLNLSCDPNKDRVSFSQTIGFGILFHHIPPLMLDYHMKFDPLIDIDCLID